MARLRLHAITVVISPGRGNRLARGAHVRLRHCPPYKHARVVQQIPGQVK